MKKKTKLKNIKEKKSGVVSARKWVRENDVMRNDRIAWQDAMPYEGVVSRGHEWNTDCGRYRIKRACQRYGGDAKGSDAFYVEFRNEYTDKLTGRKNQWWDCIPVKPRSSYCKEFGCLQDALEAAEMLHRERTGREYVQSNAEQIRSAAKKQGLSELPCVVRSIAISVSENRGDAKPSESDSIRKVVKARKNVERDKFGNGIGTRAAKINAVMTIVPKTVEQIAKESGATSIPSHLATLVRCGFVVKEGGKYKLKN